MDHKRIIDRVAATALASSIDGMQRRKAVQYINKLIAPIVKGLHRDNSWKPINKMFEALRDENVEYSITKTDYGVSPSWQQTWQGPAWQIPNDYKRWDFEVEFVNENGKKSVLHGYATAMGAGSMSDPLEKYDVVAYVS